MAELKADEERFRQYTRMSIEAFDKLVNLISHRLAKRSKREPLSPEECLVICLRFLSTGDSFHSIGINFRIGVSTACTICHEVCKALVEELAPTYLKSPSTPEEWTEIADGFLGKWQLPNALGAIDGKHVRLKAPANSGSLYFNYKQHFSTVLLIVADHRSRIICAHFGSYGRESDAGIFDRSDFRRLISDPTNPLRGRRVVESTGARNYAFAGVADRLGLMRTLHDALYGNAAAEDLRRMWRQWVRSFHAYKLRRVNRKPKFHAELSFLNELSMDQLSVVASMF